VLETEENILDKDSFGLGAPDSVRCASTSLGEQSALGTRRRCTAINHRTVRWCTGLSGEPSTAKSSLSGSDQRRSAIIQRTVRWCTRLSGEPMVDCANGRPRNPRVTRGRANGLMGHRTVRCAPDSVRCANGSKSLTVGCARIGKKSAPDSVRWCTGLSGAPPHRRQELPSWIALNGS
jgi:hypothetical protein